jgi:hypothetical protein
MFFNVPQGSPMFSNVPHLWEWGVLIAHASDEKILIYYLLPSNFFGEISVVQKFHSLPSIVLLGRLDGLVGVGCQIEP